MKVKTQQIALSKLHLNTGQIPDVPKNPRFIKDEKFESLKKSIEDLPEMLDLREIIAYDNDGELVIVGGNMRYRAMKELGYKDAPVKILPKETAPEKIRAFIIKDNLGFGQHDWDILANEWEIDELMDWGLECDFMIDKEPMLNLDEMFEKDEKKDDEPLEDKEAQGIIIQIILPEELKEQVSEIREVLTQSLSMYEKIEIV